MPTDATTLTDAELASLVGDDSIDLAQLTPHEKQRYDGIVAHQGYDTVTGGVHQWRSIAMNPDGREDNSVLGVPPELAVTSAVGIGRAALGAGPGAGAKVAAGAKTAWSSIAQPQIKYEVIKTALQGMGVPPSVAIPLAMVGSGLRGKRAPRAAAAKPAVHPVAQGMGGAQTGPAAAPPAVAAPLPVEAPPVAAPAPARVATPTASAPPAAPIAAAPVAAVPTAATATPRSAPASPAAPMPQSLPVKVLKGESLDLPAAARTPGQMSQGTIRMDLGLVARRAKLILKPEDFAEAEALVRAGKSPIDAVAEVVSRPGKLAESLPVPPPDMPEAPVTAARLKLNPDEGKVYVLLLRAGKTPQQAIQAIEAQRAMLTLPGTATAKDAASASAENRATGRWSPNRPGTR